MIEVDASSRALSVMSSQFSKGKHTSKERINAIEVPVDA